MLCIDCNRALGLFKDSQEVIEIALNYLKQPQHKCQRREQRHRILRESEWTMQDLFQKSDAAISPCGTFRHWLTRQWGDSNHILVWVMLNPSTADDKVNDPTITRCMNFSRRFGFDGLCVVNLYDFRATDPEELKQEKFPNSPDNDQIIIDRCAGNFVIAAWGSHAPDCREKQVWDLINTNALSVDCLGFTKKLKPRHPLMLPGNAARVPYRGPNKG